MKTKIFITMLIIGIVIAFNIIVPTYFVRQAGIDASLATVNETDMSARVEVEATRHAATWVNAAGPLIGLVALILLWKKEIFAKPGN